MKRLDWVQILGIGFYFAFVFCSLPIMGDASFLEAVTRRGDNVGFVLAYSGVGVAAVLPFVSSRLSRRAVQDRLMTVACLIQSLCVVCLLAGIVDFSPQAQFGVCLLIGAGGAFSIFMWGYSLVGVDADNCERMLISVLAVAGALVVLSGSLFRGPFRLFLALYPLVSLMCWYRSSFTRCAVSQTPPESMLTLQGPSRKEAVLDFLKTALAFCLIGFVWQYLASYSWVSLAGRGSLFALGFLGAAVALWLFIQFAADIKLESMLRWLFPLVAVALMVSTLFSPVSEWMSLVVACLAVAAAHAALEMLMRLQIISKARGSEKWSLHIVGCGFFAISLGAVAGEFLYYGFSYLSIDGSESRFDIAFVYTLLVFSSALFRAPAGSVTRTEDEALVAPDLVGRVELLKENYGLSSRECEVLLLVLEGRSRPYIREKLYISKSTVDTHLRHIFQKTGVASKQELIDLSK